MIVAGDGTASLCLCDRCDDGGSPVAIVQERDA